MSNIASNTQRAVNQPISGKTLIASRWIAIAGQTIAVTLCDYVFDVQIPVMPCLAVILLSVFVNVIALLRKSKPIGPILATIYLGYDILQLAALLYLTGGLDNPFFVLMIAPAAIGASVLPRNHLVVLVLISLVSTFVLSHMSYPLISAGKKIDLPPLFQIGEIASVSITLLFITAYISKLSMENRAMQRAYQAADAVLSRQRQLTALGAQASAAAHELGSPLSTIAVIAKELKRDLGDDSTHAEDINLLLSQSERCRDILSEFGRAPKSDPYLENAPVKVTLKNIADTFQEEHPDKTIIVNDTRADTAQKSRLLAQDPEIVHGIGVFVQNALEFAKHSVNVTIGGDEEALSITIQDDGPGFQSAILSQLGQPYVSSRLDNGVNRGLGIFIAQTILEDTGARVTYGKASDGGASVTIQWKKNFKRTFA